MEKKDYKISIKDVAKHAQVGLGTVSRAINDTGGISEEKKQKVMESIAELGYTPNRLAQSMRSQKYKNVVFFVDLNNITFSRIANGIYSQLEEHGYMLTLCNIGSENVIEKISMFMSGRQFDGIILAPPQEDDEDLNEYLQSLETPIVTIEIDIPGIPNSVNIDYRTSVKKATNYMLSLGHKNTALLCGSSVVKSNSRMIDAFKETYKDQGLSVEQQLIMQRGTTETSTDAQMMLNLLYKIKNNEITAVLCMNTQLLHHLLQLLRDNHLQYPDDVSIIAIEDYELTQLLNPPLTVIKRSLTEIGERISQILINYINYPETYGELPAYNISSEFIIRESCKAIPREK
ncbi:LacI family DNA-binding transcriptional regulator [Salibacterium aidingense]|uniref:LacI family DNA-binding transcriptional regulator n=1 Tax=Salibacterium aidingense TaxID=384933 RepID=UPI003BD932F0